MKKLDIIPKPFAEWSEEHMDEVGIAKMSITYTQEQDNNSPRDDDDQYLTVEAIGGDTPSRELALERGNYYYVISTNRWALSNPDELSLIIKDFENRLYHGIEEKVD